MTRHKHAHTGLVTPSPLDRWIDATLRGFAMLVQNVASTLQMIRRRPRVNATRATPADLPRAKTDTHPKETNAVQQDSLASARSEQAHYARRPSKDERVLTTPSASLGSRQAIHLTQSSIGGGKQRIVATKGNSPLPVCSTGGGGLRALARKAEGCA